MVIDDSHYAAFSVNIERITDLKNNLVQINIDFSTGPVEPYTLDDGNEVYIDEEEYIEFRKKIHLKREKIKSKKVKQLRDKKGKFMSKEVSSLIQKLAKSKKKSINDIKKTYLDNEGSLITDVSKQVGQHDIINSIYEGWSFNKKTGKFIWRKRKTKPPIISVNITTYDKDVYTFEGDADKIWGNPDFRKLLNREMNRIYKSIQKTNE
tara:strand:+ start:965 stop:1588 length:624 start_codon:yes stop_codon:yes gene_type:complete